MPSRTGSRIRFARLVSRLVGAIGGFLGGVFYGAYLATSQPGIFGPDVNVIKAVVLAIAVAFAATFALIAPRITVEPFLWLQETVDRASPAELLGGVAGLVAALLVSALAAVILSQIPFGIGLLVSIVLTAVLIYIGVTTGTRRRGLLPAMLAMGEKSGTGERTSAGREILLDTSVLIDARIIDIARAGFAPGRLLISSFVVLELQQLADAGDPLRRARGKRGLEIAEALRQSPEWECDFVEAGDHGDVDTLLVRLAQERHTDLMTNDHNLNRVASVAGVRVLNLNDLANALKPAAIAGEEIRISITKEGRELHQGVGYLEDGTMVVVEGGREHLGETVVATVTSVLQTPSGRMIFSSMEEPKSSKSSSGRSH